MTRWCAWRLLRSPFNYVIPHHILTAVQTFPISPSVFLPFFYTCLFLIQIAFFFPFFFPPFFWFRRHCIKERQLNLMYNVMFQYRQMGSCWWRCVWVVSAHFPSRKGFRFLFGSGTKGVAFLCGKFCRASPWDDLFSSLSLFF